MESMPIFGFRRGKSPGRSYELKSSNSRKTQMTGGVSLHELGKQLITVTCTRNRHNYVNSSVKPPRVGFSA